MSNIVVIGGSAGSIEVLKVILQGLPSTFPAAVLVVVHVGAHDSMLPAVLAAVSKLPVRHALQDQPLLAGEVLIAPPDLHLTVARSGEPARVRLSSGPRENHARPAIDPLFRSAASRFGGGAVGIVLSGFLDDGTVGLQAIKACGGLAIVQDPGEAQAPDMPASAIKHVQVDMVCRAQQIAPALVNIMSSKTSDTANTTTSADQSARQHDWVDLENRMLEQDAGMAELERVGTLVPLTCPECAGTLWKIDLPGPARYRCHTGHAFTARVLKSLQDEAVEEALWAALRALHEQEQLYRQLYKQTQRDAGERAPRDDGRQDDRRQDYLRNAERARESGKLLRDLIAARLPAAAPDSE